MQLHNDVVSGQVHLQRWSCKIRKELKNVPWLTILPCLYLDNLASQILNPVLLLPAVFMALAGYEGLWLPRTNSYFYSLVVQ